MFRLSKAAKNKYVKIEASAYQNLFLLLYCIYTVLYCKL